MATIRFCTRWLRTYYPLILTTWALGTALGVALFVSGR